MNEIIDFLRSQYASYGYIIVLLGAYLENTILMGLIFPGGTLLILGGVFAAQGTLNLPLVILLGWVGMFLGTSTDYWIGRGGIWRLIEKTRLRKWLEPGLKDARILLHEKGALSIFLAHFLGQIRTFVAVTAGIVKMPYRKFGFYEFFASLLWNCIYIGAGFLVGGSISAIEGFFKWMALAAIALTVVSYIWWKKSRAKILEAEIREKAEEQDREQEMELARK